MDADELRAAVSRWQAAGLIDTETAQAIQEFESTEAADGRPLIAKILAGIGAILIGAGVIAYLAANWSNLGWISRSLVAIVAPILPAVTARKLGQRNLPLATHAVWVLSEVIVGPSIFILVETHSSGMPVESVLLAWGAITLPMGHAASSRIGVAVGLIPTFGAVLIAAPGSTGVYALGAVGAATAVVGSERSRLSPGVKEVYLLSGIVTAALLAGWLVAFEGAIDQIDLRVGAYLGLALAVGFLGVLVELIRSSGQLESPDFRIASIGVGTTIIAVGMTLIANPVPELVLFAGSHILLGMVLANGVQAGIQRDSRLLIEAALTGFGFQILSLIGTIADELSGALTLIGVGILLILAGIVFERGRRRVLARMDDR